jgi:hypothetical protein
LSSGNKEIEKMVGTIMELFGEVQSMKILGNRTLNVLLEKMAVLHQPYISFSNGSVALAITDRF